MKISKNLPQADKSNKEETPINIRAVKLSKSIIVILMFLVITLMSSCFVSGPPGQERHGDRHGDRHQHSEHNDERH
jgi:hypothetical protein